MQMDGGRTDNEEKKKESQKQRACDGATHG